MQISCVEDNENIRLLIAYALQAKGFTVSLFSNGLDFESSLSSEAPDLVLLDLMLPGKNGMEILKDLKQNPATREIPVIIMTAKTSESDIVKGLDSGADDYVKKPFGVLELISRIRSVLRRTSGIREEATPEKLKVNGIVLDETQHKVWCGEKEVVLTKREYELLHYLMINCNIVLSRNQMMEAVWHFSLDDESRTIDMHIKSLRKKMGKEGKSIHTVRGIGYRLEGKNYKA